MSPFADSFSGFFQNVDPFSSKRLRKLEKNTVFVTSHESYGHTKVGIVTIVGDDVWIVDAGLYGTKILNFVRGQSTVLLGSFRKTRKNKLVLIRPASRFRNEDASQPNLKVFPLEIRPVCLKQCKIV